MAFKVVHSDSDGHSASPGTGLHCLDLCGDACADAVMVHDEKNERKERKRLD